VLPSVLVAVPLLPGLTVRTASAGLVYVGCAVVRVAVPDAVPGSFTAVPPVPGVIVCGVPSVLIPRAPETTVPSVDTWPEPVPVVTGTSPARRPAPEE
jgi:hypothetical protein